MADRKVQETLADRRKQIDDFTHTYMRLYEPTDCQRLIRTNNLGKLFISIGKGPLALACGLLTPFDRVLPLFATYPLIYKAPLVVLVALGIGKALEHSGTWYQYKVKQKMYAKYKDQMDLDKDQVLRLEAEEQRRLKLEHKPTNS